MRRRRQRPVFKLKLCRWGPPADPARWNRIGVRAERLSSCRPRLPALTRTSCTVCGLLPVKMPPRRSAAFRAALKLHQYACVQAVQPADSSPLMHTHSHAKPAQPRKVHTATQSPHNQKSNTRNPRSASTAEFFLSRAKHRETRQFECQLNLFFSTAPLFMLMVQNLVANLKSNCVLNRLVRHYCLWHHANVKREDLTFKFVYFPFTFSCLCVKVPLLHLLTEAFFPAVF